MNVLERHIHIFGHLCLACVQVDQLIRDLLRIEIEWADPAQPLHLDDLAQQEHQTPPESKVDSVVDSILGNKINLLDTLRRKCLNFSDDRLDRPAPLFAPHKRNSAERAIPVTSFSNLHKRGVRLSQPYPCGELVVEIRRWRHPHALFLAT